ncbi:MAG: hypothetical protein Q8902_14080 [Bacteroidota bacterium]|nr:hypothetical protein [Bacteroidota bacterium]
MMKLLLFLMALLFVGGKASAQYRPQPGTPGEFDTIILQKAQTNQVGIGVIGSVPGPDGYNRLLVRGYPDNPNAIYMVRSGPGFDLRNRGTKLNLPSISSPLFGHFHSTKIYDMLVLNGGLNYIYWADSNGSYDSNRTGLLVMNLRYWNHDTTIEKDTAFGGSTLDLATPYIAHLTSDSLDDFIGVSTYTWWPRGVHPDSNFCLLYKAKPTTHMGRDTIWNDDLAYYSDDMKSTASRGAVCADFRGTGRKDYLAFVNTGLTAKGVLLYYRNDTPFNLSRFAQAILYDTLFAPWQNPEMFIRNDADAWYLTADHILPKAPGDSSVDFCGAFIRSDDNQSYAQYSANIWKGGPNFGSHRLFAKDTDFCVRSPQSNMDFFGTMDDMGDLTGTGNNVVYSSLLDFNQGGNLFYVMGQAADSRPDMIVNWGNSFDSITADGDNMGDLFATGALPGPTWAPDTGSLGIIHGTRKIPVKLNPRWASVAPAIMSGDSIGLAPNPCSLHSVVTWESACSGSVKLHLYDALGREVFHETRATTGSLESFSLDLPRLASGEYYLVLEQEPCTRMARLVVEN